MKQVKFKFAPKFNSHRFPQSAFSSVAYKEDGRAGEGGEGSSPAPITKADLVKTFNVVKEGLETSLKGKVEDIVKNADQKLEAAKSDLEKAIQLKDDATKEEIEKIADEAKVTQKAFDLIQTQFAKLKAVSGTPGNRQHNIGEDMSFPGLIKSVLNTKKEEIISGKIVGKAMQDQMTIKAVQDMNVAGNVNTGVVPNTYRSGFVMPPYENVHIRDLVAVTPSDTDSYHFFRFNVGEGSIAFQNGELQSKAQIDYDLSEQVVNLDFLAGFLKISRKLLKNFNGLQSTLQRWLPEQYYEAEDTKAYQALLNAVSGVGGVQDATGTDMMSVIIRTIGKQRKAKYNVNAIVVDGEVWGKILTYKASTSGEFTMPIGVVNIRPDGTLTVAGIPVYTASWVGGDEALIGDWRYMEIIQGESLSVGFFEQDDKNVQQNKITVRIEALVGFAILDPKAFVVASLESVS